MIIPGRRPIWNGPPPPAPPCSFLPHHHTHASSTGRPLHRHGSQEVRRRGRLVASEEFLQFEASHRVTSGARPSRGRRVGNGTGLTGAGGVGMGWVGGARPIFLGYSHVTHVFEVKET